MIQLATDPNASRPNWRPAAAEAKDQDTTLAPRRRSGHAWPFISRHGERPAPTDSKRTEPSKEG